MADLDTEQAAKRVTEALGGTWMGRHGMCRCPAHNDRGPSLSVTPGRSAVLYHCFAGCDRVAIISALKRLRINGAMPSRRADGPAPAPAPARDLRELACDTWKNGIFPRGTPAEVYLKSRAIEHAMPFCRYHPFAVTKDGDRKLRLPALLLPVVDCTGIVAIQRIFLTSSGTKANITEPKKYLGRPAAGAIRYGRIPDSHLNLAEGFEDAVSAADINSLDHCWAAGGIERYGQIEIPASVRSITIWSQHGPEAARAIERGRDWLTASGRRLSVEFPPPGQDWNDRKRELASV